MQLRPWMIILILALAALLLVVCGPAESVTDRPTSNMGGEFTPTVDARSSSASGVPSFIQKGQTYRVTTAGLDANLTVIDILDDGWLQVRLESSHSGWFHLVSGTYIQR